jgi:hypothetical protein
MLIFYELVVDGLWDTMIIPNGISYGNHVIFCRVLENLSMETTSLCDGYSKDQFAG